ncbi:hypothetical protein D1872_219160 [compost metagenome]
MSAKLGDMFFDIRIRDHIVNAETFQRLHANETLSSVNVLQCPLQIQPFEEAFPVVIFALRSIPSRGDHVLLPFQQAALPILFGSLEHHAIFIDFIDILFE